MNRYFLIVALSAAALFTGCAVAETGRKIIGYSTETLEKAKADGVSKNYDCDFDACFDAVLSLAKNNKTPPKTEKFFDVFMKNRIKGHIVVMGVPGNVDTTEVGIFFSYYGKESTTIEISSLALSAKRKVADAVFEELDLRFNELE